MYYMYLKPLSAIIQIDNTNGKVLTHFQFLFKSKQFVSRNHY